MHNRSLQPSERRPRRGDWGPSLIGGALLVLLLILAGGFVAQETGWLGGSARAQDPPAAARFDRVIVLGIDGVDHKLLSAWMDEGLLPNFSQLARMGDFLPLGTSTPPQSPVAWSNFITGADSGVHGIFDFIHRDPRTYLPFSAMSAVTPPDDQVSILGVRFANRISLPFSDYLIPLNGGTTTNMRRGTPFWDLLTAGGWPAVIQRVPVNFPPTVAGDAITLSGMGTPDVQGTNGTYSYYTNDPPPDWESATGGKIFVVDVINDVVEAKFYGPPNDFVDYEAIKRRTGRPVPYQEKKASIPFKVYIDAENPVAKVVIDDQEIFLEEGQFSPWVHLSFSLLPAPGVVQWAWKDVVSVDGTVQFYLKSTHPTFGLYVTPVQIDPSNPALPISTPPEYATELAEALGPFFTQGMPEDTKALEKDVFGNADFMKQAMIILDEETRMAKYELERFERGLLFLYFTVIDQCGHAMWRTMRGEEEHPAYVSDLDDEFKDIYPGLYEDLDAVVGLALEHVDDRTLLIVMSDHGFSSWRRGFNLNRWLHEEGYLAVKSGTAPEDVEYLQGVDWNNTSLYGMGINGLYVNQLGRERYGIVPPGLQKRGLLEEVSRKLEAIVDPATGKRPILRVYLNEDIYHGPCAADGPDAQIGYELGYRVTDESAVGEISGEVIADNTRRWSGDHCADPRRLPGVILTNAPIRARDPELIDLAPTILATFGVPPGEEMTGKNIL
ncbi:MAG: alkaline phosphatase family protein [Candidatus Eisenbacteria sp.]|nr:alkaline phosphatase family protein [Candidatus Eisenbacteria bacterium]